MILAAGYLAIFLGLIHSFLGEILIFQKLRDNEPRIQPRSAPLAKLGRIA